MSLKSGCCTICLEPLCKDIQVGHCGHVFHRSCIYRWIDSANTCPNCKQHLDASELTNLFLEPLEIIKEVMNDPMVLQSVDPKLLLKFAANKFDTDNNNSDDDDDDVDLQILNLKNKDNKKAKKNNINLQLVQQKIKTTALTKQNDELNIKISELSKKNRKIEDEKSDLNRKIQTYLKSAQTYERKFFDSDDKISKLTIDLFKKNQELNAAKKDIDKVIRNKQLYEHCESISIGNMSSVNSIEMNIENKDKEYWYTMYLWIKKEYQKNKTDRERDKKSHLTQQKQWGATYEDLRIQIDSLSKCGMQNVDKISKYKKHYYSLKDKHLALREKFKNLQQKYTNIQSKTNVKNKEIPHIDTLSIDKDEDDINSISYDEQENIHPEKHNDYEQEDDNDNDNDNGDEDDDIKIMGNINNNNNNNNNNMNYEDGIFSYPNNNNNRNNAVGFGAFRQIKQNSAFAAYRQIKSKKDNESRNPFSNINRKRNFTEMVKGGDGRGGTKAFLNANINYKNNRNKRRRIVKTSSSSNNNNNRNNNRNNRNNRNNKNKKNKPNISNYFKQLK